MRFTIGSKTKEGTGAGKHGIRPAEDFFIQYFKHPTVFQAEIIAILECCQENLWLGYKGKSISIFSDSQRDRENTVLERTGVQLKVSL